MGGSQYTLVVRTCQGVLEGREGMVEVCGGTGSEARCFHEERGGQGEGGSGGGVFRRYPA